MTFNTTTEGTGPGEARQEYSLQSSHAEPLPESLPPKTMPIAIIGMSCRFPGGATTPSKLWDLCANGRSAWSPIPEDRFNTAAWHHPDKEHVGTSYVQGGHFLNEDVSAFDASFFNLSSEAAASMDPEVRLQLECVYEAFENAGLSLDDVSESNTAVCAGTCFRDFHDSHMRDPGTLERTFLTGNGMAMIANRVSHFYNLTGPSIAVDTGCSTTLTLLHMACQSLRTGESRMAVVGGSNVLLNPDMFIWGTIGGLLSAEGRCFAFDSRASGYGRGEGAASLVLKPLEAAIRDGDPIRAVIRETAVNQDGKTATLTSPSGEAQQQLMRDCYSRSGLDPRNTGYVQAHGTGTQAGDSTEATALGTALAAKRPLDDPLIIGSMKTNIGHTEAASGLAGVIQAVLAIEHERIPPLLNFETPNPSIAFEDLRLRVPRSLESWPRSSLLRASVNNFGYGGSNAHAIIEHPKYLRPYYETNLDTSTCTESRLNPNERLLKLSARDEAGVRVQVESLKRYARQNAGEEGILDRLAYTLGQKRTHLPWSTAVSATSLEQFEDIKFPNPQRATKTPRIGYVFSGQGAQWFGMGRELLGAYPVFYEALLQADRYLQDFGAAWSLLDELQREEESSRINEVAISLPASVAIQLALVRLLQSWGIEPAGVTGHSSGEVAAAFAVGAIDMRSALAIVYSRGTLTTEFQKIVDRRGGMIAVGLSREETQPYLENIASGQLVVACVNSPSSVTVSGDFVAIEELEQIMVEKKIFARRLRVDAAYHSHHMLGIADAYREALRKTLTPAPGFRKDVIYSSPVTGERLSSAEVIGSAEHWVMNMVQPVEFLDSLTNMCRDPDTGTANIDILLEIGPHAALKGPIRQTLTAMDKSIPYTSCLVRGTNAVSTMQEMAANLVMSGCGMSLASVNFPNGSQGQTVLTDLDPYPWNHQTSHWSESRMSKEHRKRKFPVHDLLGALTADSNPSSRRWRHIIRPSEIPWVRDHRFQSDIVYPGAGYVSMAIEAIRQTIEVPENIMKYELRDIDIGNALVIPDTATGKEVQICLEPCAKDKLESGWCRFQILSVDMDSRWTLHCEGQITVVLHSLKAEATQTWKTAEPPVSDTRLVSGFSVSRKPAELYQSLERSGLQYGPSFSNITSIQASQGSSSCQVGIANCQALMPMGFQQDHVVHPSTLDAVFQAVYTALPQSVHKTGQAILPRSIEALTVDSGMVAEPGAQLTVLSKTSKSSQQGFHSNANVYARTAGDHAGPMLELTGLFCQSLGMSQPKDAQDSKLCFALDWKPCLSALPEEGFHKLFRNNQATEDSVEHSLRSMLELLAHERPHSRILEVGSSRCGGPEVEMRSLTPKSAEALIEFDAVPAEVLESAAAAETKYDLIVVHGTPVANDLAQHLQDRMPTNGLLLVLDNITAGHEVAELSLAHCRTHVLGQSASHKATLAVAKHPQESHHDEDILVVHAGPRPSDEWMSELTNGTKPFTGNETPATCISVADVRDTRKKTIIFLDDPEDSVLARSDPYVYHVVQCGLLHSQNLLWISRGATMDCSNPKAALHLGLMRTLRCEYPLKRYASLDYATASTEFKVSEVSHIVEAFRRTFCTPGSLTEFEYSVHEDILHLPRFHEDRGENAMLSGDASEREDVLFHNTERDIRLSVGTPGLLDTLAFTDDESIQGPLPADYIQIKPAAFGLNFRDVMVAMGQLDETRMGFECSGFVEAIGSEAALRGFKVGDPVYAFLRGYFANTIRVHHTSVAKVPEGMDMATAASIPLVFITAYQALHNMARIRENERILIHSGTGGVGQAAIMLAQLAGAEVFVTVGSKEKQDFLTARYKVPEDHIFNSRNASFAQGIMTATKGIGVDVVLNSLAGDLLAATWKCVAPFGRFIEIGKRNLELNSSLGMGPFIRSVTFSSLDLITLGELRGDIVADIFIQINALLRARCIRAVAPVNTFSIAHAEKAYRTMQAGKHMGKIVLVPGQDDIVQAMPRVKTVSFSPNYSYLIVGGLGGIGRSIAQWMVEKGARSLILLSRNAGRLDDQTKLWLDNFRQAGVRIAVEACDAADEQQLAPTLMNLMMELPPIRGVIQAAMVLKDELFENMKLPSYEAAVRPKLQGSWNLHRLLPADMDFFIMLSSISGIGGNATQGNYAAGATFQDALARFRSSQGRPGVSVDLGMVKGIGVLAGAEGKKAASRLERIGLRALAENEVLQLVEGAVRRGRCAVSKSSQMVTGVPPSWTRPAAMSAEELTGAPFWIRDARFSQLESKTTEPLGSGAAASATSLSDVLHDASVSNEQASDALSAALKAKLALMFVVGEEDIDESAPLAQLGVDSLLAVELRNWLSAASRTECSVFDIMQSSSTKGLAERVVAKVPSRVAPAQ